MVAKKFTVLTKLKFPAGSLSSYKLYIVKIFYNAFVIFASSLFLFFSFIYEIHYLFYFTKFLQVRMQAKGNVQYGNLLSVFSDIGRKVRFYYVIFTALILQ